MEDDDPWKWSIERVVQELCTSNRSWQPPSATSTPDFTELASVLRAQEVTGSVLLSDVDDNVLRNDFNIKTLGKRAFIRRAIEDLRLRSENYQSRINAHFRNSISIQSPSIVGAGQSFPPFAVDNPLTFGRHPQSLANPLRGTQIGLQSPAPLEETPQGNNQPAGDEFESSDFPDSKRRKLASLNNSLTAQARDQASSIIQQADEQNLQDEIAARKSPPTPPSEPATSPPSEKNVKKRKRIAPTLISSHIDPDRDREIPTPADDVVQFHPEKVEPGKVFISDDGKKRLVPIHQPESEFESSYNYDQLLQRPALLQQPELNPSAETEASTKKDEGKKLTRSPESHAMGYLGKRKLPVDDIFYAGTEVGHELSPSDDGADFAESYRMISGGRRLYVHRVMKNFLHNSERQVFVRNGKYYSAVRPYPSKLVPRFYKPCFTLYYANDKEEILSKREELPFWPEVDPDAPQQEPRTDGQENRVTFGLGTLNELASYGDTFDPESLDKYRYVQGGDEILPIYGESDEENEYDPDTWAEIEEEQGMLEKPLRPLKNPHLSLDEVNQAIDESIAEIVSKWRLKKLPKQQRKARGLWTKLNKSRGLRKDHINRIQEHLDRINNDRIPKLRKEIASEVWTSQLQVRKQTRIMEQSIFDRESLLWEISMLEGKVRPEKPIPKIASSKAWKDSTKHTDDGQEEGESISSDTEASSSDEDIGDFVIDDSPSAEELIEMNLADSENENGDTDVSDMSISTPSKKSREVRSKLKNASTKSRASNREVSISDGPDDRLESPMPGEVMTPGHISTPSTPIKSSIKESAIPNARLAPCNSVSEPIVLSSDDSPVKKRTVINLITPRKKEEQAKEQAKAKKKLTLTNGITGSPFYGGSPFVTGGSTIAISDEESKLPDMDNLPPYDNPDAIAIFSPSVWQTVSDRSRLLISLLSAMEDSSRTGILTFLASVNSDELWRHMSSAQEAMIAKEKSIKGVDQKTFQILEDLVHLFIAFIDCKYKKNRVTRRLKELDDDQKANNFAEFYSLCQKLEGYFTKSCLNPVNDVEDDDEGPQSAVKRRRAVNTTTDDDVEEDSPHKKRKKKIFENAQARDMREHDRARLEALDLRRKNLQKKLALSAHASSQHDIIINDGKFDYQGYIKVHEHIAPRIKKHQIDGVRFMWNQIVTDEKSMQGCLLAHTMGLGKTMQVITLLVAIAEASRSPDKSIYLQIPENLRVSKTLVLCPPGLIDNWMDELLTWVPGDILGDFRKIDAAVKLMKDRLRTINDWYLEGGVLIMGYEMLRMLVLNRPTKTRPAPLSDEQHDQIRQQLLDGPNIIIADEAHRMKNANSSIARSTAQFKSTSRIALTGSPLANNVEEYHTMIDWVAPNYLGPAVEFRAKYVEPIQQGLWNDSSTAEKRKSLKMLGVLKEDLAPKVHRADMSVLRNDLPPKKEFVITIPLTDLQVKAYIIYVRSMVQGNAYDTTRTGEIKQTTLWHWLTILSLLCNHPDCFNSKLNERKQEARKGINAAEDALSSGDKTEEDAMIDDFNIWKVGVTQDLVNEVTKLFKEEAGDLKAIDLSNKVKILCQILDASKLVGDKVLVFSQSLQTLGFLENLCKSQGRKMSRLDGKTIMGKRQGLIKDFNTGDAEVYLISTAAGGLGLNITGANRVVIFDFKFNPIMEEQAVGRAYRIGQLKPVFVYRFVIGGTFETTVLNKTIFKMQLASRVVDKKNPLAYAKRKVGDFLFEPKEVEQKDLAEFKGMDVVLDSVLASQTESNTIRAIVQSDTFERDDEDKLTAEEEKEVKQLWSDEQLKRSNPVAYSHLLVSRSQLQHRTGPVMQPNLSVIPSNTVRLQQPNQTGATYLPRGVIVDTPPRPPITNALPSVAKPSTTAKPKDIDNKTRHKTPETEKLPLSQNVSPKVPISGSIRKGLASALLKQAEHAETFSGSSSESALNFEQLTTTLSRKIATTVAGLATPTTRENIDALLQKATLVLQNDRVKCQSLFSGQISLDSFARSIIQPSHLRSSSSNDSRAIQEVCIIPFKSRPPASSLNDQAIGDKEPLANECQQTLARLSYLDLAAPSPDASVQEKAKRIRPPISSTLCALQLEHADGVPRFFTTELKEYLLSRGPRGEGRSTIQGGTTSELSPSLPDTVVTEGDSVQQLAVLISSATRQATPILASSPLASHGDSAQQSEKSTAVETMTDPYSVQDPLPPAQHSEKSRETETMQEPPSPSATDSSRSISRIFKSWLPGTRH